MSGLQKLCKMYGRIKVGSIMYVWDYVDDKAVKESEMTKERFVESEKIKWQSIKKEIEK